MPAFSLPGINWKWFHSVKAGWGAVMQRAGWSSDRSFAEAKRHPTAGPHTRHLHWIWRCCIGHRGWLAFFRVCEAGFKHVTSPACFVPGEQGRSTVQIGVNGQDELASSAKMSSKSRAKLPRAHRARFSFRSDERFALRIPDAQVRDQNIPSETKSIDDPFHGDCSGTRTQVAFSD